MTGPVAPASVPNDAVRLPSGKTMPLLGFGTWQLTGRTAQESVETALAAGYRHIDTAAMYGNERQVGAAVRRSGLARDEVFLTSKVAADRFSRYGVDLRFRGRAVRSALEKSLEQLGVSQLDLWLVHWPPRSGAGASVWEQFAVAQSDGLVRDIGVSNYSLEQVDELTTRTEVMPAVNQIQWSPLVFDRSVLDGHRTRGVVLEGYSGLKGGVLKQPVVHQIADRLGCTPAQVVIRWHLDHDVVVIPRSRDPQHIRTNAEVANFRLSDPDLAALDALRR